jgi:hypothetical protein
VYSTRAPHTPPLSLSDAHYLLIWHEEVE